MDEKSSRYPYLGYPTSPPAYEERSLSRYQRLFFFLRDRSFRRTVLLAASAAFLWWFFFFHHPTVPPILDAHDDRSAFFQDAAVKSAPEAETPLIKTNNATDLVPLEAHVMSKCPDAKRCLQDLIVPAMEHISAKVDFRLSFIGDIDPTDSDAVSCKHGPPECLGNMILLCAGELFPPPILSLGFANCVIGEWKKVPERSLIESCALEHGVSFEKINDCISDEGKGIELLRESVQRSKDADVVKSCTVRVAGEKRCVMDGNEWKDCEMGHEPADLIKEVERLFANQKH